MPPCVMGVFHVGRLYKTGHGSCRQASPTFAKESSHEYLVYESFRCCERGGLYRSRVERTGRTPSRFPWGTSARSGRWFAAVAGWRTKPLCTGPRHHDDRRFLARWPRSQWSGRHCPRSLGVEQATLIELPAWAVSQNRQVFDEISKRLRARSRPVREQT